MSTSKTDNLLTSDASEFLSFIRIVMVCGLVFHHVFELAGSGNFPRNGMLEYEYLLPSALNSLLHMAFMASVPLLSIVSGYLFANKPPRLNPAGVGRLWFKKAKSLAVPMVLWGAIWLWFGCVLYLASTGSIQFDRVRYDLGDFTYIDLINAIFGVSVLPFAYQFWFIHDLILTFLLAPFFLIVLRHKAIAIIGICAGLVIWFYGYVPPKMFSSNVVFFFWVGMALRYLRLPICGDWIRRYRWLFATISLLFLITLVFRAWLYLFVEEDSEIAGYVMGEHYLKGLRCLGVVSFFWFLYLYAGRCKGGYNTLTRHAGYSFMIFAMHFPMVDLIEKAAENVLKVDLPYVQFVLVFAIPLLTIYICIRIAERLKRHWPALYRTLNGGR